jgi:hypothetical protein
MLAVVSILFAGSLTGCQYSTEKNAVNGSLTTSGSGVTSGTGGSGTSSAKLDANCMSGSYDACIFLQNPVAEKGSPFTPAVTNTSDLRTYQTYGVPITGLDTTGFLQNNSYQIKPQATLRVTKAADGTWKYPYSNCTAPNVCTKDTAHRVSQLMAYYWLNFQVKAMTTNTGTFFATQKFIQVDPFIPGLENAYWDSQNTQIALGEIANQDLALSAEVYLHENGHANVHYASMGNIEAAGTLDIACDPNFTSDCCSTNKGCPGAINEGLADFHAGIIFPNDTALGEAIVNATGGFIECGLPRDIATNVNLTAAAAYTACPVSVRGEIHVTGRVYASVWWEIRKAAAVKSEIETLFTEHLRGLAATDDFETAAGKIIALDNTLFAGKHVAAITAEFGRRGLTPR